MSCCHHEPPREEPPLWPLGLAALCVVATATGWWLQRGEAAGPGWPALAAFAVAYLAGGWKPIQEAAVAVWEGRLSVDLLMILAAAGAATIGEWGEGGVLLFLFSLSGALEQYAMYATRRSIDALVQLRPREATRVVEGRDEQVEVEHLAIGDLVRIHPGERLPVDGEVASGDTFVDESTLTGESTPVNKTPGSQVFAGTLNGRGSVLIRMTRSVADTTLARIIELVQEAQAQKTPTQRFVERWQGPYVAAVLLGALGMFLGAWAFHSQGNVRDAFYHAMVLLVAASPCAVVASVPSVMLSAIARGAMGGVLFKGGVHVQTLGEVGTIAFDKTGTITAGRPKVTEVWHPPGGDAGRLLAWAAAVERQSEHHLADAVAAEAASRGLTPPDTEEFESHTGLGVHAHVEGLWMGVGREALFASHSVALPADLLAAAARIRAAGETALIVAAPRAELWGVLAVADRPRPEAASALAALKRLGIERIVLLTGDHEQAARAVADAVHADEVRAQLLPDQKVLELKKLMAAGQPVAMIGDGVNDAPALAAADVGIAMGGAGTDVALETADVVLMRDDLTALPFAVWLGRRAMGRIQQNVVFSLGVIGVLVLATFIDLPLYLGVIGHEGSTLLVVLNGVRLLWESPTPEERGA